MTIKDCLTCGGIHYGSSKCPYILAPCVVCGAETILACADCAINSWGKQPVHICDKTECWGAHEKATHPAVIPPAEPPAFDEAAERAAFEKFVQTERNYIPLFLNENYTTREDRQEWTVWLAARLASHAEIEDLKAQLRDSRDTARTLNDILAVSDARLKDARKAALEEAAQACETVGAYIASGEVQALIVELPSSDKGNGDG